MWNYFRTKTLDPSQAGWSYPYTIYSGNTSSSGGQTLFSYCILCTHAFMLNAQSNAEIPTTFRYICIYRHIYDISIYRLGWQVYAYGIYIYFFIFQIFKYTKYVKCGCWGWHNKSSNSWEKIKAPIPTVLHLIEPQAFTQTLLSLYTFILRFYLPLVYYESHP